MPVAKYSYKLNVLKTQSLSVLADKRWKKTCLISIWTIQDITQKKQQQKLKILLK